MEFKMKIDDGQIPKSLSQYPQHLKDPPVVTVARGRTQKKKRQKENPNFKNAIRKTKQRYLPKMQLATATVDIMDDFISHFLSLFDHELRAMKNVRKAKTLTVQQMEIATKLCLPKMLQARAVEFGQKATQIVRRGRKGGL